MKENYLRLLSAAAILGAFSITCAQAQGPGIGPILTPTPNPVPVTHAIAPATLKSLPVPSMNTSKPAVSQSRLGHVQQNVVINSQARATNITRAVAPRMVVPAPSRAHVEPMGMGVSSVMNAPTPVEATGQPLGFH